MAVIEGKYRFLLVHDPQVQAVVRMGPCHEVMVVYHIQSISVVIRIFVKELRVLVDLPENNLPVKTARDDSVFGVLIQAQDIRLMAIVGVHVHHFPDIPYFHAPIVSCCVELIVFLIKLDACDSVFVPKEGLDLPLIVNVPNSYNSVFAAGDKVLSVRRNCESHDLIVMALDCFVKLFSLEKHFGFGFDVPHYHVAIFGRSDNSLVIRHPFQMGNRLFMPFHKLPIVFGILRSIIFSQIIKQFVPLLQNLILELLPQIIVLFSNNVDIRCGVSLKVYEEIFLFFIFGLLTKFLNELFSQLKPPFISVFIFILLPLIEKRVFINGGDGSFSISLFIS
jgi:hypothetical protein